MSRLISFQFSSRRGLKRNVFPLFCMGLASYITYTEFKGGAKEMSFIADSVTGVIDKKNLAMSEQGHAEQLTPEGRKVQDRLRVARGGSLISLLAGLGADRKQTQEIMNLCRSHKLESNFKKTVDVHVRYVAQRSGHVRLDEITFYPTETSKITIVRGEDAFSLQKKVIQLVKKIVVLRGQIQGSFYSTAAGAGAPVMVIKAASSALSYGVNFQTLRGGAPYELMYEVYLNDTGAPVKTGNLLYASLVVRGKPVKIYGFHKGKFSGFYSASGQTVRRSILRTPLESSKIRISSHFTRSRKHPILGYCRAHKGVDYAAPRGTSVLAAGAGVVEKAGWNGGYGRYVLINHRNGLKTAYAHLHRIQKGIRRGVQVKQRQKIGTVGSTGTSTGNHLHFETIKAGRHVNPLSLKIMPSVKLGRRDMNRFKNERGRIDSLLKKHAPISTKI